MNYQKQTENSLNIEIKMIRRKIILLLFITFSMLSCENKIGSAQEAMNIIQNTEWEHPYDLNDIGLGDVSTYIFFSSDKLCYIYPKKGGYKSLPKSAGFRYEIHFEEGKHNVVQICVNGCDNPNTYYLEPGDKLNYVQFGEKLRTEPLKKVN
jgi:hypothetical protein